MFVRDDGRQADLPAPDATSVRTADVYGPYPSGVPSPYVPMVMPYAARVHGPIYTRPYASLPWVTSPAEVQGLGAVEARPAVPPGPNALRNIPVPSAHGGLFGRGSSYGGGIFDGAMSGVGVFGPGQLINMPQIMESGGRVAEEAVTAHANELGNKVVTQAQQAASDAEGAIPAAEAAINAAKACDIAAMNVLITASDDLRADAEKRFQSAVNDFQELAELAGTTPFPGVVNAAAQSQSVLEGVDRVLTGTDGPRKSAIAEARAQAAKCKSPDPICKDGERFEDGKCVPVEPEVTKAGFGMGWLLLGAAAVGAAALAAKKKKKRRQ